MSSDSLNRRTNRVGRPRADGRVVVEGDVAEQILEAAAGLFARQGYTATSTRQIAAAVGLRQGSLSHYFARKKDILTELLDRTVEPALSAVDGLGSEFPPETRLWLLLSTDCAILTAGEQNLAGLMLLPEVRSDEFGRFWARRQQLKDRYRDIIAAGIRSGALARNDVTLAVDATFGLVESLVNWFDRDGDVAASDAARHVARAALAGILADPARIDQVIAAAESGAPEIAAAPID